MTVRDVLNKKSQRVWFNVPGKPVPCPRARVRGGQGGYYKKAYTLWLDVVKVYATQARLGKKPLSGPVRVTVAFYGAHSRADLDNLVKPILDGMNGVIYEDDSQIHRLTIERAPSGDPHAYVEVIPL